MPVNGRVPEFEMGAAREQLEIFAHDVIHGVGGTDSDQDLAEALRLAEILGHTDRYGPGSGYFFARADIVARSDHRYLPGFYTYSTDEHIKGLTGTIVDSPLDPPRKAELVDFLVETVAKPALDPDDFSGTMLAPAVMSRRRARQNAMGELRAIRGRTGFIGVEQIAADLSAVDFMLDKAWYSRRRHAVALAGSTAIALLSATTVRSHRKRTAQNG